MATLDKVYDLVRSGPVLPIEVSTKLNIDSFLAKAFLTQLIDAGKIKATQDKVGDVPVYHVMGHEVLANQKIKKLLENIKPAAKNFASPTAVATAAANPEIQKKREEFKARLEEIEKKEREMEEKKRAKIQTKVVQRVEIRKVEPPKVQVEMEVAEEPEAEEVAEEEAPKKIPSNALDIQAKSKDFAEHLKPVQTAPQKVVRETPKEEKPKEPSIIEEAAKFIKGEPSSLVDAATTWLTEKGAEIHNKELKKRGKEAIILASIPTNIDPMKFLVFVVNKKSITEADLSVAYSEGVQKKYPVIVMSRGKMTKLGQNYLNVIQGVVKYKQLE